MKLVFKLNLRVLHLNVSEDLHLDEVPTSAPAEVLLNLILN